MTDRPAVFTITGGGGTAVLRTAFDSHPFTTEPMMSAFTHHVFVCGNTRPPTHKRACCDPEGNQALRDAFKKELKKAGFGSLARANHAGCLDQCEHGPTVVIYPQGVWYGRVTVEDVPRIVHRTLVGGEILDDLLILDSCLNNSDCPHRRPSERD